MDAGVEFSQSTGDVFGLPNGQWAFAGGDAKALQNGYTREELDEYYSGYDVAKVEAFVRATVDLQSCSGRDST